MRLLLLMCRMTIRPADTAERLHPRVLACILFSAIDLLFELPGLLFIRE